MSEPKPKTRWPLSLLALAPLVAIGGGLAWRGAVAGGGGRLAVERTSSIQAPGPDLEGGVGWINSGPIRLADLRGKVVLLDFWTYCCINCHHVLPDLAKLEQKYPNELVVIGVHTAKFFAERDTENIRRKVHEYQIKHPVINDADQVLWNKFGVTSWPTIGLIDPEGRYRGSASGEGHYAELDRAIGHLVEEARARNELNLTPLKFFPESEKPDTSPLSFPGKVFADEVGKRLFIADTAHNRIVQAGLKGEAPRAIGDGVAGLVDGSYAKARFNRPQGICLVDEILYVADTENHAIRAIDLKSRTVATVAGDGRQTHRYDAHGAGPRTSLTSPWDVVALPGSKTLMIAMAGQHQIWRFDIATGIVGVWAGTGREDVIDAGIKQAAFAQPSGLATDGTHLFVADSEGSSIRSIAIKTGRVQTIAGTHDLPQGQSLFAFDDVDGIGGEARLQHCLGVAYGLGKVYVADTYNNKIKVVNPQTAEVKTLAGARAPGSTDDPARFYQPGGLSVAGSSLYVADTDNGKVRVIDLKEGTVSTLEFDGLTAPARRRVPTFPNAVVTAVPEAEVAPGDELTLDVTLPLGPGEKLNEEASMPYLLETPARSGTLASEIDGVGQKVASPSPTFAIKVKLASAARAGEKVELKFSVAAFVCDTKSSLCRVKNYTWNIPVAFGESKDSRISIRPDTGKAP